MGDFKINEKDTDYNNVIGVNNENLSSQNDEINESIISESSKNIKTS